MDDIIKKIQDGELIPFLGLGVFKDTKNSDGAQLPFDSDSMILSLNNGRAMSDRLMYEYSRAAMSLEQRKGREFIIQMTNHIFSSKEYELPAVYKWLQTIKPKYIIDTNMDDSLQKIYSDCEHFLITGVSRITADWDRYLIYSYDVTTKTYTRIDKEKLTLDLIEKLKKENINISIDENRKSYDHGVWNVLALMYEHLEIPVLQISIPTSYSINQLINLGEKLQQFKDEALIICSGGITHNLGDMSMNPNVRNYAKEFNDDMIDIVENAKEDELKNIQKNSSKKY